MPDHSVPFGKPQFKNDGMWQRALAELQRGNFKQAEASFKAILAEEPKHPLASSLLGLTLSQLGKYAEAEPYLQLALENQPNSDGTLYNYGVVLHALNRPNEALERFNQALAINSGVVQTWNGRGSVLNDLKRFDEAIQDFDKAIALNPNFAEVYCNKGRSLVGLGRAQEALAAFERALLLKPDLYLAYFRRGNLLYQIERYEEALTAYDSAINSLVSSAARGATISEADLTEAWFGRADALLALRQYEPALAAYDQAIALRPGLAEAWYGRGKILGLLTRADDALAAFEKSLELNPNLAEAWLGRSNALITNGRIPEAIAACEKGLALCPAHVGVIANWIFALELSAAGFEEQQKARDYWWRHIGLPIAERSPVSHRNTRDPGRRIKIGYLAADFRGHSGTRMWRPVLLNHDKNQFEITCYTGSIEEDECSRECKRAADRWRIFSRLSDEELCNVIKTDEIDILVDLVGHTYNRVGVFARKPAPIQVSAIGTGTNLPTVDYLLSDPIACPPEVRHLFVERIFDLPCIMTIEALLDPIPPTDPPMMSKDYVTFGVFNRVSKFSDEAISLWTQVLKAVPGSRLLMKHHALDQETVRQQQLKKFAAHGVAAERIEFLGSTSRQDHLAAFEKVDISLDPIPQNGGISTLESLQVGVPVVALLGNNIPSRVSASILTAVGLRDWVADNASEYIEIAAKFASMPDHLKALRQDLPSKMLASVPGNPAAYTSALEAGYRTMWATYCEGSHLQTENVRLPREN